MPEEITAESLMSNIMETISEGVSKQNFEHSSSSATLNKLFGRQKPIHHILGGGKSADVLLWRNKKTSASVLAGATVAWVVFEWLSYNFLSILSFVLVLALLAQFAWRKVASEVPRVVLPDELFANIGKLIGSEVNRGLNFLQDVACGGNIKQLLAVIAGLWVAAIIGSWFNFLTVIYLGFVAANTLPVVYEKYADQIDEFVYKVFDQLQHNYKKVDAGVRNRIPASKFMRKKDE